MFIIWKLMNTRAFELFGIPYYFGDFDLDFNHCMVKMTYSYTYYLYACVHCHNIVPLSDNASIDGIFKPMTVYIIFYLLLVL